MAEQDTNVGDEGQDTVEGGGAGGKEAEIQAQLTAANTRAAEATLYAKMMQDPQFAAILQARAAGKQVKVVDASEGQQSVATQVVSQSEQEPDFDKMDQKQIFQHFMKKNAELVEKVVDLKVKPIVQQLEGVQQTTVNQLKEKAQQEVAAVKQDYPDFDSPQVLPIIVRLNSEFPNMKPMQLYTLAKQELGQPVVKGQNLQSEKPGTNSARPSSQRKKQNNQQQVGSSMLALRDVIRQSAQSRLGDGTLDNADD